MVGYIVRDIKRDLKDTIDVQLAENLSEILKERMTSSSVYVACFSTVMDDLSQWRGYCPSGFGYCIKFDAGELAEVAGLQGFNLVQCIYDGRDQVRIINEWVRATINDLRAVLPEKTDPRQHVQTSFELYANSFLGIAPRLKSRAFHNEAEWRLVSAIPMGDPRIKLRPTRSMIAPYVEIELGMKTDEDLVVGIIAGPTPHGRLAFNSLMHLHYKIKIGGQGTESSAIPYRDW